MSHDRLSEVAARHPNSWSGTKGYGDRVWATRRANQFKRAVELLLRRQASLDELRLAAHEISDQLTVRLNDARSLTRGYEFAVNRDGALSLALDGVLFGPSFGEPPAPATSIHQLTQDLSTGWLEELGKEGDS